MKLLTLTLVALIFPLVNSVVRFILDEEIEKCDNTNYLGMSKFEFILINDTTTIANGSVTTLTEIKSPYKAGFFGEQFYRGQWLKQFERKFDDFCKNMLSPTEMY